MSWRVDGGQRGALVRFLALAFLLWGMAAILAPPALALPSYARQTGQQCAACHNGFPELTPYGRLFKMNGYTFGGGQSDLPPVAAMEVTSFTHTQAAQGSAPAPHFGVNNNIAAEFESLFYGGAISSDLGVGAFAQLTRDNVAQRLHWDNTDIRWARATTLDDSELVLGASLNNNPTVTDPWNTTPAWRYPFQSSSLAPSPNASTLIESLGQQVVGADAYGFWNRLVYVEFGGYGGLNQRNQTTFGSDPGGSVGKVDGLAPYWRLGVEPRWGRNSWEVGTFGMQASINPAFATGFGTDDFTDLGFDTQYQFLSDRHSVSVQASWIHENQTLNSSFAQGNSSNLHNHLDSVRIKSSYYLDQTYGVTLAYFNVMGTSDSGLYSSTSATNSPNSAGWIAELDYMPFNHGGPAFWPWLNAKVGLQYVAYTKFDGGTSNFDGNGHNANDNNTIYAFVWMAF